MKKHLALATVLALGASGLAAAGDREDVLKVLDQYIQHEQTGNMIAQGKLMTDDRAMVYVGGRLTGDNRKVMQEQQQDEDKHAKEFPGVHYKITTKDVRVQTWNGTTALATMDWYPTRVVPASLPAEKVKALEPAKTPMIVALVFVKQQGVWKIAFSTFVPREEPKGS